MAVAPVIAAHDDIEIGYNMDMINITPIIYFIDNLIVTPENSKKMYEMNYYRILDILKNTDYHKTLDYVIPKYSKSNCADFQKDINETIILKNNDAVHFLEDEHNWGIYYDIIKEQKFIPDDAMNIYTIFHMEDGFHYFIVVSEFDTTKMTPEMMSCMNMNFALDEETYPEHNRHFIRYFLTEMHYHDLYINNLLNDDANENPEILRRISECNYNYMTHKMIEQPKYLRSTLMYYQLANIYWMQQQEISPRKIILDDSRIVSVGPEYEFVFTDHTGETVEIFQKRRNIATHPVELLNEFNGGCLCDDVGLGKTIQMLTLATGFHTGEIMTSLILVPNHLEAHWVSEFQKHFRNPDMYNFIVYNQTEFAMNPDLMTIILCKLENFDDELKKLNYTRVIVDEFHEICDKDMTYFSRICEINALYKWAISATPLINESMIFNIAQFISKNKPQNKNISKYKSYLNVFSQMFRRNTKESTKHESNMKKIKELVYYFDFSEKEKLFYDSLEITNNHEKFQRKLDFCIHPNIYFMDNSGVISDFKIIDSMDSQIFEMHEKEYHAILNEITRLKKELFDHHRINIDSKFFEREEHLSEVIIQKIEKIKQVQNGEIPDECTILQCGHIYCHDCIEVIFASKSFNKSCVVCKKSLKNTIMYRTSMKKKNNGLIELIQEYGTKIANLINILKSDKMRDEKVIIYSYSPSLIANLVSILNKNEIVAITPNTTTENISTTIDNFEKNPDIKVLVLSSEINASGLNIICASTVIILQPIRGDYLYRRQIENQIIGRIHRIGQKKDITFIRMIVRNSIESEIETENKLNDSFYEKSSNFLRLLPDETEFVEAV